MDTNTVQYVEVVMQTLLTVHQGNQDRLQALPPSSPDPSTMKPAVFSVTKRCGNIYCATLLGTPVHLFIHANSQSAQHKAATQCIYATEASSRADLNTQRVPLNLEDHQQQNLRLRLCFVLNPNPVSVSSGSKYNSYYLMVDAFLKLYLRKWTAWIGSPANILKRKTHQQGGKFWQKTVLCPISILFPTITSDDYSYTQPNTSSHKCTSSSIECAHNGLPKPLLTNNYNNK